MASDCAQSATVDGAKGNRPGPALLFSGQGSQAFGMGRDIAEQSESAMRLWERAEKASGLPLREIYWQGDEKAMSDTRALQPALTVANFTLWQEYSRRNKIAPEGCAGHSLGEFCALAAAGAIAPEDAIDITALRGKLMADADPEGAGAMAAVVKLGREEIGEIVAQSAKETGELLVAANFNTPEQTVISGHKKAVEHACKLAKERKGKSVFLKVSGAFHSPLMEAANKKLASLIEKAAWRDPAFPVYCNIDGMAATSGAVAKKKLLGQMISPVYWVDTVRNLYLAGIRWWLEISPRAVLGKMVGPSLAGVASECDAMRVELINSLANIIK